jgi:hypothetical protein
MSSLKYIFWITQGAIFFIFAGLFSYFQVSSKFMQDVYLIDETLAGILYAFPYYFLIPAAPLVGYYNSKNGNKLNLRKLRIYFLLIRCL